MAKQTPEGKVKHKIIMTLESYGIHRPSVWMTKQRDNPVRGIYFMPVNNGMGESGVPDFICTVMGRSLLIEAKSDASKKPTAYQQRFIDGVRAAKGIALVIHKDNLDLLDTVLQEIINANPRN